VAVAPERKKHLLPWMTRRLMSVAGEIDSLVEIRVLDDREDS
jgi:hypothetical protein